jgi:hypothetical protein
MVARGCKGAECRRCAPEGILYPTESAKHKRLSPRSCGPVFGTSCGTSKISITEQRKAELREWVKRINSLIAEGIHIILCQRWAKKRPQRVLGEPTDAAAI